MKKKKTITLVLILFIIGFFSYNALNNPDVFFNKYISSWEKMDFKKMYSMLSKETKSSISEEQFIDRYTKIYKSIGTNSINIVPHYNSFSDFFSRKEIVIPFDFSMNTLAGPVDFTYNAELVREFQNWHWTWTVIWNQKLIYPDLDDGDGIYISETKGQRGEIYDINANQVASNGEILAVGLVPEESKDKLDNIKKQLNEDLGISSELIDEKLNQSWVKPDSFVPIMNISMDNNDLINKLKSINGVTLQEEDARVYPYKEAAGNLIGYVNSEGVGVTGVEKIFDSKLRAKNGYEIYIKDSQGNKKETIAQTYPDYGYNVDLSIDMNLQTDIYNEMKGETGAAVAINPKTGQVLAMVSTPSYDPNMFILGNSAEEEKILKDPKDPLLNRFAETYAPGSTIKPVIAAIGIENGSIDPEKQIEITGKQWQPDKSWGNYKITRVSDLYSKVDLNIALEYSDNIYFAQAALRMGAGNLLNGAGKFGIGEEIPFDFPMKTSQVSDDGIKDDIQLADTGYGQGQMLINPLQLALMYSAFLNDGNIIKPYLQVTSLDMKPQIWKSNVISKKTAERVLQGLVGVVNSTYAPARTAKVPGEVIGGKTGTAELKTSINDPVQKQNGWFVAFNANNPQLLIVMMIENVQGRGESHFVIPKVQKAMQDYFDGK